MGKGIVNQINKGIKYITFIFLLGLISPTSNARETVGLVLSGGGAKGIAHVGVIKALEENDIPVDYVAGTSMGAIVGSLYSCGWSPEQMMTLFTEPAFHYWSTGTINRDLVYYFAEQTPSPEWVGLNINFKDSTNIVSQLIPTSLINPIPMNLEFLELYSPYTEQCKENFNNLFVPFRCVTSDIYHKHKIVCKSGSLGDAVRASMSFPLVFKPIEMDGVLVYDGGIYDNFPVDVMREDFHPDFIIGVSVSSADTKPIKGNIYSQLEDMIIQNNDYNLPEDEGVKIQVPVLNFGVLDFQQAKTIYEIGYKSGLAMVDSIKKRLPARESMAELDARRKAFAAQTPVVEFDTVEVIGASKNQSKYLKYLFEGEKPGNNKPYKPINLEQVKNGYYRAVTTGKLYDLLPQAKFGANGKNTLLLEANVKSPWNVGIGGWVTSSANSMLYLTFGYHTLSFNSLDIDVGGWIGQAYFAGSLSAKIFLPSKNPSYLQLEGVASKQKYYESEILFYQWASPSYITDVQEFVRLNYCWAMGRPAKGYVSFTAGRESNEFYPYNQVPDYDTRKDKTVFHTMAFKAGAELNTLNDLMYPSSGKEWNFNVIADHNDYKFLHNGNNDTAKSWSSLINLSAELIWRHYFNLHKNFKLGAYATGLVTFGNLLDDYTSTLIHCPAFAPTPSTKNYFNPAFRSNNYLAAGLNPVWTPITRAQLRGDFYYYTPVRNIGIDVIGLPVYNGWFKDPQFIGEIAAVYNFPFASLSFYVNYLSSPKKNWNFGLNFGLYFHAPKLLR